MCQSSIGIANLRRVKLRHFLATVQLKSILLHQLNVRLACFLYI